MTIPANKSQTVQLLCCCANCGHECVQSGLRDIKHYHMRVDADGPEPDGECPKCGALSYEIKPDDMPMKTVRITLAALVRKEYVETLRVPASLTDEQLNELVNIRYQDVGGEQFQDDPEYWERAHCQVDPAGPIDEADGIVSCANGRLTVQEVNQAPATTACAISA